MGPTGATGKYILSYLIASSEWKKITIIHRREVDLDDISKKTGVIFTDEQKSKVTQHKVDMEKLCENDDAINTNVELFKDHEVTFCVLGIFIYFHYIFPIQISKCIKRHKKIGGKISRKFQKS